MGLQTAKLKDRNDHLLTPNPKFNTYSGVPNRSAAPLLVFTKKIPSYMLLLGAYMFIDFPKFSCLHDYLGLRFHVFLHN